MTPFEQMLQADAVNVFAGAADFGEPIVYRRKDGREYPFTAQVFRLQANNVLGAGGKVTLQAAHLEVFIPFDPAGVNGLSEDPDEQGDVVVVKTDVADCPSDHRIASTSSRDVGGWTLTLR